MDFGVKAGGSGRQRGRVGLDIGTRAVKIIEVLNADGKLSLGGFSVQNIQGRSHADVVDAVKLAIRESKISAKDAVISISGPSVIVRFIVLPRMSEVDMKSAVKFEAEKFIPFNMSDCISDFQLIKKERKDNKIDVLLAAAKKDLVMEKIKIADDAGLSVAAVDIDSFAITNAFLANFPSMEKDKTVAIINIGAKFTNLVILTNGTLSLVRDIAIGSEDFNTAISKIMGGIDAKAAEELKLSPGEKLHTVSGGIRSVVSNLFDEVKLSFSYHENQSGKGIDEVYVSGGGSYLIGMEGMFQEFFGPKPIFWNAVKFLGADAAIPNNAKNYFAVAAGLALR